MSFQRSIKYSKIWGGCSLNVTPLLKAYVFHSVNRVSVGLFAGLSHHSLIFLKICNVHACWQLIATTACNLCFFTLKGDVAPIGQRFSPVLYVRAKMAEIGEAESPLISVNESTEIDIEGDITVPGAPESDEEPSTLDEPVSETLVQLFCLTCISDKFSVFLQYKFQYLYSIFLLQCAYLL